MQSIAESVACEVDLQLLQGMSQEMKGRISKLQMTQEVPSGIEIALDTMWTFACSVEICMMQLGFAMLEAGFVREQNMVATYLKNILDFLINIFVATLGSYNLAYPDEDVYVFEIGVTPEHHSLRTKHFFNLLFQGTAATIVSGAMAERVTIKSYMALAFFLSGLLYPMAVRLTWGGGYLAQLDEPFHDFAGSGVVHMVGGSAAFVGAVLIGPRTGRWDESQAGKWVPHNLPLVLFGMLILWCGWYGFNTGSSQALSSEDSASMVSAAFVSTTTSAAAGGATVVILGLCWTKGHSIDVLHLVNGILGGLVAIAGGCNIISGGYAMIVGSLAALVCMASSWALKKMHVDDVCDAISVHGVCGIWGLVAVGLFHEDKGVLTTWQWDLLRTQVWGGLILCILGAVPSGLFMSLLKVAGALRVSLAEESMGMDKKLGIQAYVRSSQQDLEFDAIVSLLLACKHTPKEALDALTSLKSAAVLTLTPQAGDNRLEGELEEIISLLDTDGLTSKTWDYFIFILHQHQEGGEVAQLFAEALRSKLHKMEDAERIVHRFKDSHLAFRSASDMPKTTELLSRTEKSMNIVVLLTAHVLRTPAWIAAIARAHRLGRRVVLVRIVWPDMSQDPRSCRMPEDLNKVIKDLRALIQPSHKKLKRSSSIWSPRLRERARPWAPAPKEPPIPESPSGQRSGREGTSSTIIGAAGKEEVQRGERAEEEDHAEEDVRSSSAEMSIGRETSMDMDEGVPQEPQATVMEPSSGKFRTRCPTAELDSSTPLELQRSAADSQIARRHSSTTDMEESVPVEPEAPTVPASLESRYDPLAHGSVQVHVAWSEDM